MRIRYSWLTTMGGNHPPIVDVWAKKEAFIWNNFQENRVRGADKITILKQLRMRSWQQSEQEKLEPFQFFLAFLIPPFITEIIINMTTEQIVKNTALGIVLSWIWVDEKNPIKHSIEKDKKPCMRFFLRFLSDKGLFSLTIGAYFRIIIEPKI